MPFAEGTPTVSVQLGGKDYTLGWTWGAKRRLRERVPNITDANALAENMGALVWASMDKESRESVTVEDIEELINPRNEAEVADKISQLFVASEPKEDPGKNAEPAAVKEPTAGSSISRTSGRLESTISA